ncbi:MAG TPA: hypothetical protein VFE18_15360 [Phenylobacterium sp.]|jgi:hypothetical protein|uniref:hypothetical protein n=1 Tax=Phenylobacterium sp. TaxID=1871053 RepID=UPI002D356722|nr:hypothetical protein [Phenylobacterium sp.]HZZ69550.1 hypothetical protein [Phenylobacterium sp.]
MTSSVRQLSLLLAFAAFAAAGATRAQDASPSAPVATAPATAAPLSTAEQIDNYLKTSPTTALPQDSAAGVTSSEEPRKIHGVVDVAAGSNGYRSAFVASELPVGKTATVTIAVGQTRFDGRTDGRFARDRLSGGGRQALGLSFDGGGDPTSLRCRQAAADGAVNLDPRFGGGRACRPLDVTAAP